MTGQRTAVFGVFSADSQADRAVSRLTSAGFSNSDISLLDSTIDDLLAGMQMPDRYEGYAKERRVLLLVHCLDDLEIERANTILQQNGAERIFATGEKQLGRHSIKRP